MVIRFGNSRPPIIQMLGNRFVLLHTGVSKKKMITEVMGQWNTQISTAKKTSQKFTKLNKFKNFGSEQTSRASYFSEMADVIKNLDLSNPHENTALTIEPTHPIRSKDLNKQLSKLLDKLNISKTLHKEIKDSKLTVISLAMLKSYAPESDATKLINSGLNAPFYLLDPLYGFIFFPNVNRISNHCFAIDLWTKHLSSMPKKLSSELWKNRSDNMLSGGAFAGRLIFKDILPEEADPLKQSMPPEISVNSEEELTRLIDKLKSLAAETPGVELWFRGQNKEYLTPERLELAKVGIAPYSNIRDSDFTPSLYRNYDDFLDCTNKFENMVKGLAEWVYHAKRIISLESTNGKLPSINGVASVSYDGLSSYQHGLILQQYGAPSAYLDITSDHNIATWFATHSCTTNKEGKMEFSHYISKRDTPENTPTLFVFPLVKGVHPYLDLSSILSGTNALRAERQKCGLLGGAGNLARNYCARYLGLKIRLGPNFKVSKPKTANYLFPPESEDLVLKQLKSEGMGNANRVFPLSELAYKKINKDT